MGCEKYKISETEQSIEEKSILDKGVNLQELLKMPGLEIAGKDNYSQTGKPPITEISMEELAPHLDLSETYLLEDEEETILMAPVRTPGSYARNLVSIRSKGVNLDFTMTYPDPSNRNLFYVTDLKERYVLKIEVDAKGNGNTTIIHIPEIESESFIPCEEMVYVSCSSGMHSFSSPHEVWECIYWYEPSGTPPRVFMVAGPCGNTPGGGGGSSGEPVNLPNNPPNLNNDPNEGAEVPPGNTEAPPFVHIDCIPNLDCEDCNIPGDINNDCMMEPSETFLNNLDAPDRAWYLNPDNSAQAQNIQDFLEANYYSAESVAFAEEVIGAIESDDFSNLFVLNVFTQDPYDVWKTLSQAEKDLIKSFPIEAYIIFKNRPIAEQATKTKFGYNGRNDKSDAFRHAYFNAINTMDVGAYMAELFSNAHESEVPSHLLLEKQMDLFNNAVGHNAQIDFTNHTDSELVNDISLILWNGGLMYLSPLGPVVPPNFGINPMTQLIPTNQ